MNGQPNSDVYLLGAGFARAISPAMPLLQGLAERVLSGRKRRTHIPAEVVAMMRENFAHALSYLEQAKPWVTEADNLRDRALYLEFSNAIARDLDITVERAVEKLRTGIPSWLISLIRHWHSRQCTVVTLNYDTLVETIAASITFEADESIAAQQLYPPLLTDAGLRSSSARLADLRPSFRLLKLHGSTNWFYSGRTSSHGEPIYFVPPLRCNDPSPEERRDHEFRTNAVADKYPFLVPPVYDKTALLTHETIRALWFDAGEAVKQARRLVCMGYSLPESDLTMRHFLRTTLRSGAELVVVDPSRQAGKNFERYLRGARITVTQPYRGRNSIAKYVATLES